MSKSYETIIQENEDKKLNKYLREENEEDYDDINDRADYEYERMMDRRAKQILKEENKNEKMSL